MTVRSSPMLYRRRGCLKTHVSQELYETRKYICGSGWLATSAGMANIVGIARRAASNLVVSFYQLEREDIPRTTHSPKVEARHTMLMIDTVSRNREKSIFF